MGEHKKQLGLLSNGCLLPIPWTKLSQAQPSLLRLDAPVLCVLLLVALSLHALFLALNYAVAALALRLPVEQRKAVVIMCSQKVGARLCAVSRRRASPGLAAPSDRRLTEAWVDPCRDRRCPPR